jgi:hypothetical protein
MRLYTPFLLYYNIPITMSNFNFHLTCCKHHTLLVVVLGQCCDLLAATASPLRWRHHFMHQPFVTVRVPYSPHSIRKVCPRARDRRHNHLHGRRSKHKALQHHQTYDNNLTTTTLRIPTQICPISMDRQH